MHHVVEALVGKMIVSCQAYEDTPFYGPDHIKIMAESVLMGGADAIRACWPQDIKAIRSITDKPIIGIYKEYADGNPLDEIFITPSFMRAKEVIEAGADIVGIDCTIRKNRGYEEVLKLLKRIKECYPQIAIMADIATLQEGIQMEKSGYVDIISTTLNGYTRESMNEDQGPNVTLMKDLKKHTSLPINGEGRIWTIEDMNCVLKAGADMVTIGTAITRPHLITERFLAKNNEFHQRSQAIKVSK